MKLLSSTMVRVAALALVALASNAASAEMNSTKPSVVAPRAERQTQPVYAVQAGLDGEVYPMFANYASMRAVEQRSWGIVTVKIQNSSDEALHQRVSVKVQGWSDEEIQVADVAAGTTRTLQFAPTFLPRLYRNREITAATASVAITDNTGAQIYATTVPLRMRSADDIYWGKDFKYANYIASWVTPHDAQVEQVLARAKNFMPGRRLPGYESVGNVAEQERTTRLEARAIFRALQTRGVSYVKSSMTLGRNTAMSERVRTPGESLRHASANCVDGAVMYASLFENLGMEPVVVLLPGHAIVGVRLARGSNNFLYIDTALTGRSTFEAATAAAQRAMTTAAPNDVIRVAIPAARGVGIFPMPVETATSRR